MNSKLAVVALVLNGFLLIVLVAVPVMLKLGLAPSVEVPRSAILGWFLVTPPSMVAMTAIAGTRFGLSWAGGPTTVQLALVLNAFIVIVLAKAGGSMYLAGRNDLLILAIASFMMFSLNTALLARYAWSKGYFRRAN